MVRKSNQAQANDEAFRLAEQQINTFIRILTTMKQQVAQHDVLTSNPTYQNAAKLEDMLKKAVAFYNQQYHASADSYQYLPSLKQQTLTSYQSLARALQAIAANPEQAVKISNQFSEHAININRIRQQQLHIKHIILWLAYVSLIATWITSSTFFMIAQYTLTEPRLYRANDILIFTAATSAFLYGAFSLFKHDLRTGTEAKQIRQKGFAVDKFVETIHALFAGYSEDDLYPFRDIFIEAEFEQAPCSSHEEMRVK